VALVPSFVSTPPRPDGDDGKAGGADRHGRRRSGSRERRRSGSRDRRSRRSPSPRRDRRRSSSRDRRRSPSPRRRSPSPKVLRATPAGGCPAFASEPLLAVGWMVPGRAHCAPIPGEAIAFEEPLGQPREEVMASLEPNHAARTICSDLPAFCFKRRVVLAGWWVRFEWLQTNAGRGVHRGTCSECTGTVDLFCY
jgi:hypothetical protein